MYVPKGELHATRSRSHRLDHVADRPTVRPSVRPSVYILHMFSKKQFLVSEPVDLVRSYRFQRSCTPIHGSREVSPVSISLYRYFHASRPRLDFAFVTSVGIYTCPHVCSGRVAQHVYQSSHRLKQSVSGPCMKSASGQRLCLYLGNTRVQNRLDWHGSSLRCLDLRVVGTTQAGEEQPSRAVPTV